MGKGEGRAILTEEFLDELAATSLENDYVLNLFTQHVESGDLPDRDYQAIHRVLKELYGGYKERPTKGLVLQRLTEYPRATNILRSAIDESGRLGTDSAAGEVETYIKQVRFQKMYREASSKFSTHGVRPVIQLFNEYYSWCSGFTLTDAGFVDIVEDFRKRHDQNKAKAQEDSGKAPVCRFYIDELDARNGGQNLRGQLTCFLAASGVGKSHIARWIGRNACMVDGLNVLHIQLEGSKKEVADAYSASLVECSTNLYGNGGIRDELMERWEKEISAIQGRIHVQSFPKFNNNVSTVKIYDALQEYKKLYGCSPDVLIVDSMDLLNDSSGRKYTENGERLKRIAVANDMKDLATDENIWVVVTYQSTIENQEWFNDEKNVLTMYNIAESKGLCRPLTHLITLNQSVNEDKEDTMRINVAKSRFFKKGEPFKIATDFNHEKFYDRERTLALNNGL